MIYGYSQRIVNEFDLHEMKEISFNFQASGLRRIANFINYVADQIDNGDWKSNHMHIDSIDNNWNTDFPNIGIVVNHPSPDPSATLEE